MKINNNSLLRIGDVVLLDTSINFETPTFQFINFLHLTTPMPKKTRNNERHQLISPFLLFHLKFKEHNSNAKRRHARKKKNGDNT